MFRTAYLRSLNGLLVGAIIAFVSIAAIGQAPQEKAAPAPAFAEKDREFAMKYLTETRQEFMDELAGLSDAQLNYRAAEGRWTIGEIAEHIIVVEDSLFGMITNQVMKATPPTCENPFRVADRAVILTVTNRSERFTAPEAVRPNGRWKTRDELISNFERVRGRTMEFMKTNTANMRDHFAQNAFGMLDSFQWMLFMTGHSERHLAQLKEVKATSGYPAK